jgi:glycosyltransferase involved in cell wall biosynthesis
MKVVAVIPAFNEEKTIFEVVSNVKKYVDEVIVVDDGSNDNTLFCAKNGGAITCSHFINRGQGAALETGKQLALSRNADIIVHYDADGQFLPEEIRVMVEPIINGEADVVLGTRFLKSNIPLGKKFFLQGAILLSKFTSGLNLTDTHNGFRALSSFAAEKIIIEHNKMAHASEILDKIGRLKLRFREIPVTLKYFSGSTRKGQRLPDYFRILFDLFLGRLMR